MKLTVRLKRPTLPLDNVLLSNCPLQIKRLISIRASIHLAFREATAGSDSKNGNLEKL